MDQHTVESINQEVLKKQILLILNNFFYTPDNWLYINRLGEQGNVKNMTVKKKKRENLCWVGAYLLMGDMVYSENCAKCRKEQTSKPAWMHKNGCILYNRHFSFLMNARIGIK